MLFLDIDPTGGPDDCEVGNGIDEGTIDIRGKIDDEEFCKALDNTAVGGFVCIGNEGGAVINLDVVGACEYVVDRARFRLIMAADEGGGPFI